MEIYQSTLKLNNEKENNNHEEEKTLLKNKNTIISDEMNKIITN